MTANQSLMKLVVDSDPKTGSHLRQGLAEMPTLVAQNVPQKPSHPRVFQT
jgi:hypothetical protein